MIEVAVIGFGNHVVKNILPAISRLEDVCVESVYVRDPSKYFDKALNHGLTVRHINESVGEGVEWIYISTPISTHYDLAKKYLELGKNVICEKPLTDSLEKTKELLKLSESKGVCLYEVCMFQYHKQYEHLRGFISNNIDSLKTLSAKFTIPHLAKDDIRYVKRLGGGALLDVGYYPISLLVLLFGKPNNVKATKLSEDGCEVDLIGSAIFEYDNFYCIAEWGIGLPYSNEVTAITESKVVKYDRAFSKPETYRTKAQIREGFESSEIDIGDDDQFVNMFKAILLGDSCRRVNVKESMLFISDILDELNQIVIKGNE